MLSSRPMLLIDSYRTHCCSSEACLWNVNNHDGILPSSLDVKLVDSVEFDWYYAFDFVRLKRSTGRDRRAEERAPEVLCPLLQHLEQVTTPKIGRLVRSGCAMPLRESQSTLLRKFPERRGFYGRWVKISSCNKKCG